MIFCDFLRFYKEYFGVMKEISWGTVVPLHTCVCESERE